MTALTVNDLLNDIEFEIAQGLVSKEGVGPAILAVREFQNRARIDTFSETKVSNPYRDVLARQFQVTDMLLALLQEMDLRHLQLQSEILKLAGRPPLPPPPTPEPAAPPPQAVEVFPAEVAPSPAPRVVAIPVTLRDPSEIEAVMRPEMIEVGLQVRPILWPLIGKLLTKLRILYQRPALHYTTLLSQRQGPVNRVLGDRILALEALVLAQQEQINALQSASAAPGAADSAEAA
jgi:hypothetical protein